MYQRLCSNCCPDLCPYPILESRLIFSELFTAAGTLDKFTAFAHAPSVWTLLRIDSWSGEQHNGHALRFPVNG